jgi:hypothetical protein
MTLFASYVSAQEQKQPAIQNTSQGNASAIEISSTVADQPVSVSSNGTTTIGGTNDSVSGTNPVTIGALTAVAMNKVVLNVTQHVLNETSKLFELKEFVLRVSAQESDIATLNLTFFASDSQTLASLEGVSIDGWISNGTGISAYFFTGLTDSSGRATFILPTQANTLDNTTLTVEAFHRGYSSQKQSAAFALPG